MSACKTCGKQDCYAHGGEVGDAKRKSRSEKHPVYISGGPGREDSRRGDVRPQTLQKGTSQGWSEGKSLGHHFDTSGRYGSEGNTSNRKMEARENLEALKSQKPNLKGLAKGGSVEDAPDMDMPEDDMVSMCAEECFNAFEKKDKQAFIDSLQALILSLKE